MGKKSGPRGGTKIGGKRGKGRSISGVKKTNIKRDTFILTGLVQTSPPKLAKEYEARILAARPEGSSFTPVVTLYLTNATTPEEIKDAKAQGILASCSNANPWSNPPPP